MDRFVPKEKLSKKAKRELAKAQRQTWGGINPVTRKPSNPKAYVRDKPRNDDDDDTGVCSWQDTLFLLQAIQFFLFASLLALFETAQRRHAPGCEGKDRLVHAY